LQYPALAVTFNFQPSVIHSVAVFFHPSVSVGQKKKNLQLIFLSLLHPHPFYSNKKLQNFKGVQRAANENGVKPSKSVKTGGFGYVDKSL